MTPRQRELARHALGLPNAGGRSYRNRFYVGAWSPDFAEWSAMVDAGHAKGEPTNKGDPLCERAMMFFWLTPAGAIVAINKDERLEPEDFPAEARAHG